MSVSTYKDAQFGFPVEAIQVQHDNAEEVAAFCGGMRVTEIDAMDSEKTYVGINVPTKYGHKRASEGDYVIRYSNQEHCFIMKPNSFKAMYDHI